MGADEGESHVVPGKSLEDAVEEAFFGWRPDLDPAAGVKTELAALESRGDPRISGTLEERRDQIATAVKAALESDDTHVMVLGTGDEHVIASRLVLGADGEPQRIESFRIGYTMRAGLAHLDEPVPVTLDLQTADGDLTPEDVHLLDVVEDATLAAKTLLLPGVETKVGRVLSGGNAARIRSAVKTLIAVLEAAGVDLADAGSSSPPAAGPPVQAKGLDGFPDPHELVASLRAAARGES